MTGSPLYRREVLASRHNRWLGPLLLRQPVSHWIATWAAIALVAALVAYLCVGEYARKARLEGRVAIAGGTPQVELVVPEPLLGSIATGNDVWLRYRAFPHQHYGRYRGRVVRIAAQATSPGGTRDPRAPTVFVATVALTDTRVRDDRGRFRALLPGLGVDADVVVDRRPLYAWLFEPLAGLRGRAAGRPDAPASSTASSTASASNGP